MKKGVTVAVHVYVEGEAGPTADFAEIGKQVVTAALTHGAQHVPQYTVTIRKLGVDDDPPED